jgi:hypothetical protein
VAKSEPMRDQNRTAAFLTAKGLAEARRQATKDEALGAFKVQCTEINRQHTARYVKARDEWQEVKSNPAHRHHDARRDAFRDAANQPPRFKPAHDALDAAIQAADAAFHETLVTIGAKHGVSVGLPGRA